MGIFKKYFLVARNVRIKAEILVFLGIFYRFFNVLLWSDPRRDDRDIPILVHANAGLPQYEDGETIFPESPAEMAPQMQELVAAGANIVGGCCGTTPAHIALISEILRA